MKQRTLNDIITILDDFTYLIVGHPSLGEEANAKMNAHIEEIAHLSLDQNMLKAIINAPDGVKFMLMGLYGEKSYSHKNYMNLSYETPESGIVSTLLLLLVTGDSILNNERCKKFTYFDIGANIGTMTISVANTFKYLNPECTFNSFSFEPTQHGFEALTENIKLNKLDDMCRLIPDALFSHHGEGTIYVPVDEYESGLSSLKRPDNGMQVVEQKVRLDTLDEFCEVNNIDHIDLIKIDAEGADFEILKGGSKIIRKCHPEIILECNEQTSANIENYSATDIIRWAQWMGYRAFLQHGSNILMSKYRPVEE